MRVAIIGGTLIGNRGAEAMVSVATRQVRARHPDASVTLFSYFPATDRRAPLRVPLDICSGTPAALLVMLPLALLYTLLVRVWGCRRLAQHFPVALRQWAESRVMLDVSGVSFMDVRLKILPYDVLIILISNLLGTPLVKLAQAMGPFHRAINRRAARLFLPMVDHIYARGRDTFDALTGLRVDTPVTRSSDIAFLHSTGDSLTIENEEYVSHMAAGLSARKEEGERLVGLCPSSVICKMSRHGAFNYLGYLAEVVDRLLDHGYTVLLFPNATKDDRMDRMRNNDLNPIQQLVSTLHRNRGAAGVDRLLYVDRNINTDGIKRLIQHMDVNIVSRFHAMIASLQLVRPVIVLGWSHKYAEVMRDFGMEDFVFDYQQGQPEQLASLVHSCFEDQAQWAGQIRAALAEVQRLAQQQFDDVQSRRQHAERN
jgi:colanic acid/amylovoran biosynthesis protein